jgi:ATP-dependent 26S proteasome regulatory subunit
MKMLENYIRAGYPAIAITTPEEGRALAECRRVARDLRMTVATWSLTQGLQVEDTPHKASIQDPVAALQAAGKLPDNTLYILLDFHPFLRSPDVWRTAKDMFAAQKQRGIVYVFISIQFDLPRELEREIVVTSLPLPSREDLESLLWAVAEAAGVEVPEDPTPVIEAALGLTITEAENAFALSLVVAGTFSAPVVAREKEQLVRKSGVLEIYSPDANMESVGGLSALKDYLSARVSAYSPEAQAYGLPAPRGVLLVGVPGCGKSLCAKALAAEWQKPLLRLDAGRLFGSLVGESEANTRRALEVAEAVAPAVLWLDEVEKGLAGVQSSGRTDSGVTARVFGQFLTWLQEKKAPVFVVATANAVDQLPPEFLRKGRFDEIFFVDLPTPKERTDIFRVQLQKRRRDPGQFDIPALVSATDNFTGAEIEEAIVSGLFTAWNDGRREVTTDDILTAARGITPLAVGMADRIEALRAWAEKSARRANGVARVQAARPSRVIRREVK